MPQGSDTAAPWLPPPGELHAVSTASSSATGAEYVADWSHARVEPAGSAARFTPDTAAGSGLEPAGYAIYALSAEQLAGLATLRLEFSQLGDGGKAWLGTADYARGCWNWQALPASKAGCCTLAVQAEQHRRDGVMPVALVFLGATPWTLARMELSGPAVGEHPWPMDGQNPQHTGLSPYAGPQTNHLAWKFLTQGCDSTDNAYILNIAPGPDGGVYANDNGRIVSLARGGAVNWTASIQAEYFDPVTGPDGCVYAASRQQIGSTLYCFAADGTQRWSRQFSTGDHALGCALDGTVYYGGTGNWLYAVNPGGDTAWQFKATGATGGICLGPEGSIYFSSNNEKLNNYSIYKLDRSGNQQWIYWHGGIKSRPALGADGTVYAGSGNDLLALNPDGTERWKVNTAGTVGAPWLDAYGTLYCLSGDGAVRAVSPAGTVLWTSTLPAAPNTDMVLGAGGLLYIGLTSSVVVALDTSGELRWQYNADLSGIGIRAVHLAAHPDGSVILACRSQLQVVREPEGLDWGYCVGGYVGAPVVSDTGTVYFDSGDGNVYALHPDGSLKWRQAMETTGIDIGTKGNLFLSYSEDDVTVLGPEGDQLASFGAGRGQPLLTNDGLFIRGAKDGLWAYTQLGEPLWHNLGDPVYSLSAATDGSLRACSYRTLIGTDSNGNYQWEFSPFNLLLYATPVIAQDGTAYINAYVVDTLEEDPFYAVSPSGELKWSLNLQSYIRPALRPDGSLVLYDSVAQTFAAFSPQGDELWSVGCASRVYNQPAVGADGITYYGDEAGVVHALRLDGTELWTYEALEAIYCQPAIGADGTLYVGGYDGYLYAFHD